jgi:nucleotide-binding universal stress UspA family protein
MSFSFKTILVPVDFSINTEVAVQKAMEIADADGATIHLLHIHNYTQNNFKISGCQYDEKPVVWVDAQKARQLLLNVKKRITQALPLLKVQQWLLPESSVQHSIEKMAEQLKADVIVIGKKSNHSWFPFLNTIIPSELAEATGRAVLTVKPGSLHNTVRTLVVPVSNNIPKQKMDALLALSKKTRIKVHLVTFISGDHVPTNFSASALLQVYQWLKNSMHCPVEYAVLHGNNKAKAMLAYAERTNADMLLVNPTSETKIGWMNKHISDVLSPDSKVQVLTVHH